MDAEERLELAEDAFHRHIREVVAPAYAALADALAEAADLAMTMENAADDGGFPAPPRWVNSDDPLDLAREMRGIAEEESRRGLRKALMGRAA